MVSKGNRKAFSLVEMIVAAGLLSGAVVTLCAISSRSLAGVRSNRQSELGWELLDRQLTMIDYIGVEEFMEMGQFEGKFGDEQTSGVVYTWSCSMTELEADWLWRVDMTVSWSGGGGSGQMSASTVFNGTGSDEVLTDSEETTEGSAEGGGGDGR
ncbi:MAG: hypothetical protein ACYTFK_01835 [Planctomycetota bacterium]|jgi:hypothetical protein